MHVKCKYKFINKYNFLNNHSHIIYFNLYAYIIYLNLKKTFIYKYFYINLNVIKLITIKKYFLILF